MDRQRKPTAKQGSEMSDVLKHAGPNSISMLYQNPARSLSTLNSAHSCDPRQATPRTQLLPAAAAPPEARSHASSSDHILSPAIAHPQNPTLLWAPQPLPALCVHRLCPPQSRPPYDNPPRHSQDGAQQATARICLSGSLRIRNTLFSSILITSHFFAPICSKTPGKKCGFQPPPSVLSLQTPERPPSPLCY